MLTNVGLSLLDVGEESVRSRGEAIINHQGGSLLPLMAGVVVDSTTRGSWWPGGGNSAELRDNSDFLFVLRLRTLRLLIFFT